MKIISIIRFLYRQTIAFFNNLHRNNFERDMVLMQSITVANIHKETFGKYKNCYEGKDVVVIATGPSLNKYKPIANAINIGVNKSFMNNAFKLDYIFIQDYFATKDYIDQLKDEKYSSITKFYGICANPRFGYQIPMSDKIVIPESIVNRHKARKYFLYSKYPELPVRFNVDIDKNWIMDCGSIAISAAQFALFTNPKKIYLVGCDCSAGYFDGSKGSDCSFLIKPWKELKHFAGIYYPETEIISVNPVGLKGLFTDLYQE